MKSIDPSKSNVQDLLHELQLFYDEAPCGYHSLNGKGRIVRINNTELRMLGYSREEMLGQKITKFLTKKTIDLFQNQFSRVKQGETFNDQEIEMICKDGSILPLSVTIKPIQDEAGNFLMSHSVLIDIRERKRLEREHEKTQRALIESEQKLKAIVEYAPTSIYLMNLENEYILVNHHYADFVGRSPDDLLGKSIYDIFPQEIADIYAQKHRQVIENKQLIEGEETISTPEGTHTYFIFKFPLDDAQGKVYAVCGILTDITERKEAEKKMAQQGALIDITSDAMIVRDLEHRILFWNRGAENLYGWTKEEILGKSSHEILYKTPNLNLELALETTLKEGFWQGELQQVTKTGKEIIVSSRWTLVKNDFREHESILVVNTNITEKKELEKQFYAIQRLESLGNLAGGIAHDLNNILTPILAIVQLLPLRLENLDQKTYDFLKILETNTKRGANLVKQILTFARGYEGEKNVLDLKILVQEIVNITQEILPKSIKIVAEIPEDYSLYLRADPTQLHQILLNLVINARDAMPHGGLIKICVQNQFIDLVYAAMNLKSIVGNCQEGNYMVITVSDTGQGISTEILDHIFEPFFTTKEMGEGTGLGLSTILGIVKSYGGFLQVLTEVNKGTLFKVYLPATEELIIEDQPEKLLLQGNGELVLIVDDEKFIREVTQDYLRSYNYQTMIARDGIEAISLYTKHAKKISVILMDMVIPSISGLAAILTLKSINPEVRIIAHSGLVEHHQASLDAGAQAFLIKPYTIQELLETLVSVLPKKRAISPHFHLTKLPEKFSLRNQNLL